MSEKIADFKKKADEIQSSEILPEEAPRTEGSYLLAGGTGLTAG